MEDAHIADLDLGNDRYIFGVFDGHGGSSTHFPSSTFLGAEVSEYVKRHFVAELTKNKNYKAGKYQLALKETFLEMDNMMLKPEGKKEILKILGEMQDESEVKSMAGCTANVSMIING